MLAHDPLTTAFLLVETDAVRVFLQYCGEDFEEWFRAEYGGPPDLRKRRIFDAVIG